MKNTVFTVMTVLLLMATLCLPAAAQTWVLENWTLGGDDDRNNTSGIDYVEFRDNHQVFYSKHDRLYKWDLNANWLWWHDFNNRWVKHINVPRQDNYVMHTAGWTIYIRDADDLSTKASVTLPEQAWVWEMDVDDTGNYLALTFTTGGLGFPPGPTFKHQWTYDIWGANGAQFRLIERGAYGKANNQIMMDPTQGARWYMTHESHNSDTGEWVRETILEQTPADPWVDEFTSSNWNDIDEIAITSRYGSNNDTIRLAALDDANIIHVWDYSGDHLFNLNDSEGYSAHDDILEFTYNGELLVTAYDHNVRFWDVSTQALDHSFRIPDSHLSSDESIESLAFSDNGKLMAIGGSDGTVYIYEWTGGSAPAAPPQEAEPTQPTALLSNYPNPFNPETWIPYQLAEPAEVTVTIHSSDGKLVRTLELGQMPAGAYSDKDRAAYWDGQNEQGEPVASGVYFYTLTAGDFSATRKMVIRK